MALLKGTYFHYNLNLSNIYLRATQLEMENKANTTYHNNIIIVNKTM
jgi:hypothetical protein